MTTNMGVEERAGRFMLGILLMLLALLGVFEGGWAVAAYVVAGVMFVTSALWYCPLYTLYGWTSRRRTASRG